MENKLQDYTTKPATVADNQYVSDVAHLAVDGTITLLYVTWTKNTSEKYPSSNSQVKAILGKPLNTKSLCCLYGEDMTIVKGASEKMPFSIAYDSFQENLNDNAILRRYCPLLADQIKGDVILYGSGYLDCMKDFMSYTSFWGSTFDLKFTTEQLVEKILTHQQIYMQISQKVEKYTSEDILVAAQSVPVWTNGMEMLIGQCPDDVTIIIRERFNQIDIEYCNFNLKTCYDQKLYKNIISMADSYIQPAAYKLKLVDNGRQLEWVH